MAQSCPAPATPALDSSGRTLIVSTTGTDPSSCTGATAFRSIDRASQCAQPGDTVYVRAGRYTGLHTLSARGTSAHPIVFAAYPGETVTFDGGGSIGDWYSIIAIYRASYVTFSGFEVTNTGVPSSSSGGYGLKIDGSDHINILSNRIHDTARQALLINGDSLIIDGNEIYNASMRNKNEANTQSWDGAAATTIREDTGAASTNVIFRNNNIHDSWGECLGLLAVATVLAEGNTVRDCYSVNIYVDDAKDVTVNRNYVYATSNAYNRNFDGVGRAAGIQWAAENSSAFYTSAFNGFLISNMRITNNIVGGLSEGIRYANVGTQSALNSYTNVTVANNVVKDVTGYAVHFDNAYVAPSGNILANNILYSGSSGSLLIGSTDFSRWAITHNIFPSGKPSSLDSTNSQSNPQLSNPVIGADASGFQLLAGSPAIAAGLAQATVTTDYGCNPRPSAPSIGVFEVGTSTSGGTTTTTGTTSGTTTTGGTTRGTTGSTTQGTTSGGTASGTTGTSGAGQGGSTTGTTIGGTTASSTDSSTTAHSTSSGTAKNTLIKGSGCATGPSAALDLLQLLAFGAFALRRRAAK